MVDDFFEAFYEYGLEQALSSFVACTEQTPQRRKAKPRRRDQSRDRPSSRDSGRRIPSHFWRHVVRLGLVSLWVSRELS